MHLYIWLQSTFYCALKCFFAYCITIISLLYYHQFRSQSLLDYQRFTFVK